MKESQDAAEMEMDWEELNDAVTPLTPFHNTARLHSSASPSHFEWKAHNTAPRFQPAFSLSVDECRVVFHVGAYDEMKPGEH
ncbi:hypothetical protein BJ912DRAFT_1062417 [Pholiota molesta]|nr:hypothetical protein BJ912DRAFT_1062417 [Pholiota molesta]